jgi:hypothetical protein
MWHMDGNELMHFVTSTHNPQRWRPGLEVWRKVLAAPGAAAIVLFNRNDTGGAAPVTVPAEAADDARSTHSASPRLPRTIAVSWTELGWAAGTKFSVRDLWAKHDLGTFADSFHADVAPHEARIYTFTPAAGVETGVVVAAAADTLKVA